ncbi:hypothetical protein GCM10028801_30430 [Nocardioides maradonensis]
MGDVVPFRRKRLESMTQDETDEAVADMSRATCASCAHFALSLRGVSFCLKWAEGTDFDDTCGHWEMP